MVEGNYQLLTGIFKVIRPNIKPVIGITDGQDKFMMKNYFTRIE